MDDWFCSIQLSSGWHSLEFSQERKAQMRNCLRQISLGPVCEARFIVIDD